MAMIPAVVLALMLAEPLPVFAAPAGREYAKVVPGGRTILPNGRVLTPKGDRLYVQENPWFLSASPTADVVVSVCEDRLVGYRTEKGRSTRFEVPAKEFAGGVFSPDGKIYYASNGDAGGVSVFRTDTWSLTATWTANSGKYDASYLNDLVVSPKDPYLYAVDLAHQRVVTFHTGSGKVVSSAPAGREPYAIGLSEDGRSLFVANIGLFDYSVVPSPEPGKGSRRGLAQPAFGYPSREAKEGVEKEGRRVPGLGDALVPDAHSIWRYSLEDPAIPAVRAKAKSGLLIHSPIDGGAKAVGGSAPNAVLVRNGRVFVSNGNNDTIQIFDAKTLRTIRTISVSPSPLVSRLRGSIPNKMVLNRKGDRLYVCEGGLNSVSVIEPESGRVLGRIPTGWWPNHIALSPDERTLYILCQKGIGRGPRGPKNLRPKSDERYGLPDMPGMIARVAIPTAKELAIGNNEVLANNGIADRSKAIANTPSRPIARRHGAPSREIEYVVFITKENHTFDGIFGELKARGARAEPDYAEFGNRGWIAERGRSERVSVMPNHLKLAGEFAISDNFYMEPQASGDGHRWLVGVYPSYWTSRVFYAGWNFKLDDNAKGRLVSFGSNGSQIPEDYLENGSLFEHLHRGGITFRNYGEGYELPDNDEGPMTNRTGAFTRVNYPMPKVLFDNTCFNFPAYNNNIPDIARVDWFIEDIEQNFRKKGKKLPRFLNIALCNDHGAGPNAKYGYPFVASYMADNDLALGRIVEYLTHLPEWKKMAIFVTQDDSGGDNDSVDRHRSYVLAISPWAKRGAIVSEHTSIMSIIKTIYLIFGLGPNNMFDALATDLSHMFTAQPDFRPYRHVGADPRVFKPAETFDPTDPEFERRRGERPAIRMDDPRYLDYLNRRSNGG